MKADVWWVVGTALAVFLTVVGVLVDRYLCAVWWWPLVGTEWRYERRFGRIVMPEPFDSVSAQGGEYSAGLDQARAPSLRTLATEDDEWADQLHVINLDAHRDRPIHQLTHYEVEAVIRDLGVPEWVPQRLRAAA